MKEIICKSIVLFYQEKNEITEPFSLMKVIYVNLRNKIIFSEVKEKLFHRYTLTREFEVVTDYWRFVISLHFETIVLYML